MIRKPISVWETLLNITIRLQTPVLHKQYYTFSSFHCVLINIFESHIKRSDILCHLNRLLFIWLEVFTSIQCVVNDRWM